jgi:putative hemolysin
MLVAVTDPAQGMLSPGDAYCAALGYEPITVLTKKGEKVLCRLPNGRTLDAMSFFTGRVGLDASYCAQQGLQAKHVEDPAICGSCTVCVLPEGGEVRVSQLMGLHLRETTCGDGKCHVNENSVLCPADCPSGGLDEFCDGNADRICDPDCVEAELPDPDCLACVGDCNGDRQVTVDELVRGVSIAVGSAPLAQCPAFDANGNQQVTVEELIAAVNALLSGCPASP